jgi:hypothetical protein
MTLGASPAKPELSSYQPYDDGSGVNNACANDVELTNMMNIDDCAAQVAQNFASGKCPNRFFEHDPTDGDCDCCADEQFDNPTSDYVLYQLTSGNSGDVLIEVTS